jgi:ligand-binding sensor domain-containing protein/two-component sensor histidine kinase
MQRFISSLVFFFFYIYGYSQSTDPIFRHITRSSGLPVDEVTCIVQDSSGFMWLGTREGLFRYDGFSFKGFYNKPGDNSTIPGNYITQIYLDSKGLLWILTGRNGLAVMSSEGKVLQVINSVANASFASFDFPYDILEDSKGFLWCTTSNGLFKLKNDNGTIKVIKEIDLIQYHHATNILGPFILAKTGTLWICTMKGLAIYDPTRDILYHRKNNPLHLPVLDDTVAFANIYLNEESSKLWYSTWEPATRQYDLKTKITTTLYSGKGLAVPDYWEIVRKFFTDSHKIFWMSTGEGLSLFQGTNRKIFMHQNDNPFSIISNQVNNIYEDREGNFWFATTAGISITRPHHQSFLNLSANAAKEYAFAGKAAAFIVPADSNTMLIGSKGVYETDPHFKVRKHYRTGTMDYDWIWNYYKDEERQQIYISTQAGMLLYDIKTHTVKKLLTPPFNEHLPVSSFVPADSGNIWMSRYRNVFFKYNPGNKTFKKYDLAALGERPAIVSLFKDKAQHVWIVLQEKGILRFDEKTGQIAERIVAIPGDTGTLLQPNILCLQEIGKYLFVGYFSRGFSLYDKTTKTIRHFSQGDGLASNSVTGAIEKDGMIWIATTNGISRFDTVTKAFINYNYDNGILDNNFLSITQLPDGRIAAGSATGMVLFYPDSVITNRNVPPPLLSDLNVYGRKISADSLQINHQPLTVSYKENYFSIEYISLYYHNNQQIEYAYLLAGLDKNWVAAGNRRFVNYSNLKGGNYSFKVKARLPGGNWVESKFILPVIVSAAFYTQWWFYLLVAVAFVTIVYGLYHYRLQQILRMEKMRMAISSDLHDEVGATLSSISIFSEMAKQSVETSSKAETYLQRIGERSRESIEKMSDIIWSINPENDSLVQMLARMKNYANEILEAKNILVHWMEGENLASLKLTMPQRKNLYLLFKEVINNAAKYSRATNVYIRLHTEHKCIKLSVKDDGTGFDINKVQPGNGIKNIYRRSLLLNGKVAMESNSGGTSVLLSFSF